MINFPGLLFVKFCICCSTALWIFLFDAKILILSSTMRYLLLLLTWHCFPERQSADDLSPHSRIYLTLPVLMLCNRFDGRYPPRNSTPVRTIHMATFPPDDSTSSPSPSATDSGVLKVAKELRKQNENYERVLAALGEAVLVVTKSGELMELNPRAQELMAQSKHKFQSIFPVPPGWHIRNAEGRELAGEDLPAGITLRTGQRCQNVLLHMERPDGSSLWLSVNTEPLINAGESLPYAAVVSFHDVTAIKETLDKLVVREAHLARLLDAIPDLLFVVSEQGVLLDYRSPNPEKLFMPAEKFLGRTFEDVLPTNMAEQLRAILREALATGKPCSTSYSGAPFQPDRFYEARATSLYDGPVLLIVRDITEARRNEERELKHQRELAHLARLNALGEMVAGISHEVNQPINAIVNFASAILNELDADDQFDRAAIRKRFEDIRKQAYRAGEIVKRFRRFSSSNSRRSSVLPIEIVNETLEMLRSELRRREVRVKVQDHAPDTLLIVDRVQIQQVLVNLLFNACDALEKNAANERRVLIRIELRDNVVVIDVSDNGAGLPPEPIEQIFTSFFTTKPQGLGMGLAISRTILESHGGRLSARNNEDRGATFTLEIPLGVS